MTTANVKIHWLGAASEDGVLTDAHSASSYGLPVLLAGEHVFGPGDVQADLELDENDAELEPWARKAGWTLATKRWAVWGKGAASSKLIREGEATEEAFRVALESGQAFSWAVEVIATHADVDFATRHDDAVAGFEAIEKGADR